MEEVLVSIAPSLAADEDLGRALSLGQFELVSGALAPEERGALHALTPCRGSPGGRTRSWWWGAAW